MSKNKILFIVATQYDNMGDLLINKCLIDEVANYGKVYLDLKGVPKEFKKILLEKDNVYDFNDYSVLSVKGLGALVAPFLSSYNFTHVFKSPGPFGGANNVPSKIRLLVFYYLFFFLKTRNSNISLIGNDIVVKNNFDVWVFKKIQKTISNFYVRSLDNQHTLMMKGLSAKYSPDLCFLLEPNSNENLNFANRNIVSISFRDLDDVEWDKVIFENVKTFIDYFSNKNITVEFIYQVERDRIYNERLYKRFQKNPNVLMRKSILDWDDRSYYSKSKFVLSNRLHVLLLAQVHNSIPFGLVGNHPKTNKINNIFKSIDLEYLVGNNKNVEYYTKIDLESIKIVEEILKVNSSQKNLILKNFKDIFERE